MCSVHGTLLQGCVFLYGAPSPRRSTSHGYQTADIKGFLDGEIVKTHLLNLLKKMVNDFTKTQCSELPCHCSVRSFGTLLLIDIGLILRLHDRLMGECGQEGSDLIG